MRVLEATAAAITADPDGIAQAQQLVGAGNLTLNGAGVSGGVATLSPPRRVTMNSAGNIATVVFTITGTDRAGSTITDTITGINNSTVTTNKVFASVTQIAASAAVGSDVIAGWSAESISRWLFIGQQGRRHMNHTLRAIITTGDTVSYIIEGTSQNILRDRVGGEHPDDLVDLTGAKTANYSSVVDAPLVAYRLKVTTQTGTIKLRHIPSASA